ncbi:MAG: single-stranded-DNA-specific exonuclease RecJ [Planctomycetota bacterium]
MPELIATPPRPWRARNPDRLLVSQLGQALSLEPMVAATLANRGVSSLDEAERFLNPSVDDLHDPFALADMERAAERIVRAVRQREPILVYGDYDVDGLTSTALMMQFLRYLGANPHVYVPNRSTEGYSFTAGGVASVLASGAKVVISVDNGIASVAPVDELARAGVDVIITDHHLPPEVLPPAYAIVNPRRSDCAYPFKGLAGVGVAFKVACAVANRLSEGQRRSPEMSRFLGEAMAWVALGTLSDMMPLVGENRILASRGLRAIPVSTAPGLAALCAVAGVRRTSFGPEDVSFQLAPRLNAAGRLGRSDLSLALVTAPDEATAMALARQLDQLNVERRTIDRQMHAMALDRLHEVPAGEPVLLHDDRWNTGLLGLVAGRLAQQTGRPAVLISAAHGDPAKGSMRSIAGFDAHAALSACSAHLAGFGGHAMAAGFTIQRQSVPEFRRAFLEVWQRYRSTPTPLPPIDYDGELPLAALTPRLIEQFERLAPFGMGNARPVLGISGATLLSCRRMGGDGTHLELQLGQGPTALRAVAFGRGDLADTLVPGARADVLVTPKINRFRGKATPELELVDLRLQAAAP